MAAASVAPGWASSYRLPVQPPTLSTLTNMHSPRPVSGLSPRPGSQPVFGDERLAKMMLALDEHERRDPRSRQARTEATFYASLRLMLRETAAADRGAAQSQQVAQLEGWFEANRPKPRPEGEGETDSARGSRAPSRMDGAPAGGPQVPADRRAAATSRLASAAAYTPNDVPAELKAFKRRDLYSTFAAREGLSSADVLPAAARVVPGSQPPPEALKSPFANYALSSEQAVAEREVAMDESCELLPLILALFKS
jgi:hypothetical protein